jgi:glucose dehydrogenase
MDGTSRPGDNLYTVSLVCLDVATGKIRWHYQQVPHDQWGYDVASPAVLFDYPHQGKLVPAVGQAAKIGWYYIHNRLTGELLKKSDEFVEHHNTFTKPTPEGQVILPGVLGGINWSPTSVDAKKLVAYVPAIHWPVKYTKKVIPATSAKPAVEYTTLEPLMDVPRWGVLSAIDLATGKMKWQHKTAQPLVGGTGHRGQSRLHGRGQRPLQRLRRRHRPDSVERPAGGGRQCAARHLADRRRAVRGRGRGGNQIFGYKAGDTFQVYRLGN